MSEKTAPPPWAAGAATPPATPPAAPAPAAPETAPAAPAAAEVTPPAPAPAPAPKKPTKAEIEAAAKAKAEIEQNEAKLDTEQNEALQKAANAAKGETEVVKEKMVTVTVPRAYKLRVDDHIEVPYKAGIQEMPESHANHWWSVNNGVEVYTPTSKA